MRIALSMSIAIITSVALLTGVGVWLGYWLGLDQERLLLTIRAPREAELALSVYAQFVVAQSLYLHGPSTVSRLEIPIYISDPGLPFAVQLVQGGRELASWEVPRVLDDEMSGLQELSLRLVEPLVLEGEVEVVFDGGMMGHEMKDLAPRVFTESAGTGYRDGQYRIANNLKEGDVGLSVFEETKRWRQIANTWHTWPWKAFEWVVRGTLVLLLVGSLPFVVRRSLVKEANY